ncbi:UNVERIFIED_CONTAM: hypothetical protein RMT77_007556 [Armadillidium vulgare]
MDQGKKLVYSLYAYYTIKVLDFFYQVGLVFYLFAIYDNSEDKTGFCVISSFMLGLIGISYYMKSKHALTLQLRILKWELAVIAMEIVILLFAVVGYVTVTIFTDIKYNDLGEKEKLYFAHHDNKSFVSNFNETNTTPIYSYDDSTEDIVGTTTLVPEEASLSGLFSLVIDTGNTSEAVDPPVYECNSNRTTNQTPLPDFCKELYEDFYYNYIFLKLVLPNLISIIPLTAVVATLGYSEYVKLRIRQAAERARLAQEMIVAEGTSSTAQQNVSFAEELDTSV